MCIKSSQPYKGKNTRYSCPNCEKQYTFSRYIDVEGKINLPPEVGRCNRENSCGNHFTPKEHFEKNPSSDKKVDYMIDRKSILSIKKKPSFIKDEIMFSSLKKYEENHLYKYLKMLFGEKQTLALMKKYNVGTAKYWNGSTVFWQVDANMKIRTGKIMLYDSTTGRRVKKPHNHIHWIHSIMKLENYVLQQCFFGEHLIEENKVIAIVESEKTALIASQYFTSYTWIATGGLHNMKSRINMFKNHKVILFPDINAYETWNAIAEEVKNEGMQIEVFAYLEKYANEKQRKASFDIADFLIQKKLPQTILEIMSEQNPILRILIEHFELELVQEL